VFFQRWPAQFNSRDACADLTDDEWLTQELPFEDQEAVIMPKLLKLIAPVLLASWAVCAVLTGTSSRPSPKAHPSPPRLPDHVFNVQLRPPVFRWIGNERLVLAGGKLQPGATEKRTFAVPKLEGIAVVLGGDSTIRYALRRPGGKTVIPEDTPEDAEYHILARDAGLWMLTFKQPEDGQWELTASAPTSNTAAQFSYDVRADDPIVEQAHLEVFPRGGDPRVVNRVAPGDPVYVRVFVATEDRTVRGVRWDVKVASWPDGSPVNVAVEDDGHHADGTTNDGIFVGAFVPAEATIMYTVNAKAVTPKGTHYAETSRVEVEEQGDLFIADTIAVSPDPRVGKPVTLTTTVTNRATRDAYDATMLLFLTEPNKWGGRDTREEAHRTFNLPAGKSMSISTAWTPTKAQDYEVSLSVNPTRDPLGPNVLRTTVVKVR
jgi:hypothetical protein